MRRLAWPAFFLILAGAAAYYQERGAPAAPPAPSSAKPAAAPAPAAQPPVQAAPVPPVQAAAPAAVFAPATPPPAPAAADAAPAPPPGDPPEGRARVYGVVYDLLSKKPVVNAQVELGTPGSAPFMVRTDEEGHYLVDVPARIPGPYGLEAAAPGYRLGQLQDEDPPLSTLSQAERREKAAETGDDELGQLPLDLQDGGSVQVNLVMLPAAQDAARAPQLQPIQAPEEPPQGRGGRAFLSNEAAAPASVLAVPAAPKTSGRNTVEIPGASLQQ